MNRIISRIVITAFIFSGKFLIAGEAVYLSINRTQVSKAINLHSIKKAPSIIYLVSPEDKITILELINGANKGMLAKDERSNIWSNVNSIHIVTFSNEKNNDGMKFHSTRVALKNNGLPIDVKISLEEGKEVVAKAFVDPEIFARVIAGKDSSVPVKLLIVK
jgi:hypothetical protein